MNKNTKKIRDALKVVGSANHKMMKDMSFVDQAAKSYYVVQPASASPERGREYWESQIEHPRSDGDFGSSIGTYDYAAASRAALTSEVRVGLMTSIAIKIISFFIAGVNAFKKIIKGN